MKNKTKMQQQKPSIINNMNLTVIITEDFEEMSETAGNILIPKIRANTIEQAKKFNLILPTGNSPTGLYVRMVKRQREYDANLVGSWNLDEYVGLPGKTSEERRNHRESYHTFMRTHLFDNLNPPFAEYYLPRGTDIEQSELERALKGEENYALAGTDKGKAIIIPDNCKDPYLKWIKEEILDAYLKSIELRGGIDCAIVGVGGRGHIAFHESGIALELEMLLVKIDDNTIKNAIKDGHFKTWEEAPKYAISIGAGAVFKYAKNIILMAYGERKAEPVAKSLLENVTSDIPISGLQSFAQQEGKSVIYILDKEAAAGLKIKDKELEKKGIRVIDLITRPYQAIF